MVQKISGDGEKLPCRPSIKLCVRDGGGKPLCKKGKAWKRRGFSDSDMWDVITPMTTGKDRLNCCFVLYEFPRNSLQGQYIEVLPGQRLTINWRIQSLQVSRSTCME